MFPVHSYLHVSAKYLRKECGDLNEVALENDDDNDDDDAISKDVEVVKIGTGEALTMLDGLVNHRLLSKEKRNSLATMKDKLKKTSAEQKSKP